MSTKAGRPSKYNKDMLKKAENYLYNFEKNNKIDQKNPDKFIESVPSAVGLAVYLKVARSTIYEWAKEEDKKEFSDILNEIEDKQHQILINNGLLNKTNSVITKLMLTKHGYSDKQQTEISGQLDLSSLSDEELKRMLKEE
jgi:hypothetical protein